VNALPLRQGGKSFKVLPVEGLFYEPVVPAREGVFVFLPGKRAEMG
jgi:hypothetical protein